MRRQEPTIGDIPVLEEGPDYVPARKVVRSKWAYISSGFLLLPLFGFSYGLAMLHIPALQIEGPVLHFLSSASQAHIAILHAIATLGLVSVIAIRWLPLVGAALVAVFAVSYSAFELEVFGTPYFHFALVGIAVLASIINVVAVRRANQSLKVTAAPLRGTAAP